MPLLYLDAMKTSTPAGLSHPRRIFVSAVLQVRTCCACICDHGRPKVKERFGYHLVTHGTGTFRFHCSTTAPYLLYYTPG